MAAAAETRPSSFALFHLLSKRGSKYDLETLFDIWEDLPKQALRPGGNGGYSYDGIGYDVGPEDDEVVYPVHIVAANCGDIHMFKLLLNRGADPYVRDAKGRLPKDVDSTGVIARYIARHEEEEAQRAREEANRAAKLAEQWERERKTKETAARIKAEAQRARAVAQRNRERQQKQQLQQMFDHERTQREEMKARLETAVEFMENMTQRLKISERLVVEQEAELIQVKQQLAQALEAREQWKTRAARTVSHHSRGVEAVVVAAKEAQMEQPTGDHIANLNRLGFASFHPLGLVPLSDPYACVSACGVAAAFVRAAPRNVIHVERLHLLQLIRLIKSPDSRIRAAAAWSAAAMASNCAVNMSQLVQLRNSSDDAGILADLHSMLRSGHELEQAASAACVWQLVARATASWSHPHTAQALLQCVQEGTAKCAVQFASAALEVLLSRDLSAKYRIVNRLTPGDRITPKRPFIDYGRRAPVGTMGEVVRFHKRITRQDTSIEVGQNGTPQATESPGIIIVDLKKDEALQRTVLQAVAAMSEVAHLPIEARVSHLAHFVAAKMGDTTGTTSRTLRSEAGQHVVELRKRLGRHCWAVPLGMITTGDIRSRSLLFKVLADQPGVGIPTFLERGDSLWLSGGLGHHVSWNTVRLRRRRGAKRIPANGTRIPLLSQLRRVGTGSGARAITGGGALEWMNGDVDAAQDSLEDQGSAEGPELMHGMAGAVSKQATVFKSVQQYMGSGPIGDDAESEFSSGSEDSAAPDTAPLAPPAAPHQPELYVFHRLGPTAGEQLQAKLIQRKGWLRAMTGVLAPHERPPLKPQNGANDSVEAKYLRPQQQPPPQAVRHRHMQVPGSVVLSPPPVHDGDGVRTDGRDQPVYAHDVALPFRNSETLIDPSTIGVRKPVITDVVGTDAQQGEASALSRSDDGSTAADVDDASSTVRRRPQSATAHGRGASTGRRRAARRRPQSASGAHRRKKSPRVHSKQNQSRSRSRSRSRSTSRSRSRSRSHSRSRSRSRPHSASMSREERGPEADQRHRRVPRSNSRGNARATRPTSAGPLRRVRPQSETLARPASAVDAVRGTSAGTQRGMGCQPHPDRGQIRAVHGSPTHGSELQVRSSSSRTYRLRDGALEESFWVVDLTRWSEMCGICAPLGTKDAEAYRRFHGVTPPRDASGALNTSSRLWFPRIRSLRDVRFTRAPQGIVGTSATSTVYKGTLSHLAAMDRPQPYPVALKMSKLPVGRAREARHLRRRLQQQVRVLSQFRHPHVVPILACFAAPVARPTHLCTVMDLAATTLSSQIAAFQQGKSTVVTQGLHGRRKRYFLQLRPQSRRGEGGGHGAGARESRGLQGNNAKSGAQPEAEAVASEERGALTPSHRKTGRRFSTPGQADAMAEGLEVLINGSDAERTSSGMGSGAKASEQLAHTGEGARVGARSQAGQSRLGTSSRSSLSDVRISLGGSKEPDQRHLVAPSQSGAHLDTGPSLAEPDTDAETKHGVHAEACHNTTPAWQDVQRQGLDPSFLLDVLVDVAAALSALHAAHEIVGHSLAYHGDVRPSNILLWPSPAGTTAKLTAVNVSVLLRAAGVESVTEPMAWRYMAPEMVAFLRRDSTSRDILQRPNPKKNDVYAFGVLLGCIATGENASDGDRAQFQPPYSQRDVSEYSNIPALGVLYARCVASNPAERPTIQAVANALRDISLQLEMDFFFASPPLDDAVEADPGHNHPSLAKHVRFAIGKMKKLASEKAKAKLARVVQASHRDLRQLGHIQELARAPTVEPLVPVVDGDYVDSDGYQSDEPPEPPRRRRRCSVM